MKLLLLFVILLSTGVPKAHSSLLSGVKLTKNDSILVVQESGEPLFSWQVSKPLMPASLTKLATALLAIEKWGLEHRFHTDFLIEEQTLWVKGYGDPYLISEELDRIVARLVASLEAQGIASITNIYIDNSHFDIAAVPGRSKVADPYNAPVSAVAANFNTAKLQRNNGRLESAEVQTPLTNTARKLAHTLTKRIERVNLINTENAQSNFAELLVAKLGWSKVEIETGRKLASQAKLVYRHENSHTLADVLRGTLEFSNNFIANQVFLKLSESVDVESVSFNLSSQYSNTELASLFDWQGHYIAEGSGLSRSNRLSAEQIDDLLAALEPQKDLLKKIKLTSTSASVYAKTGTLSGVRSYAGFIEIPSKSSVGPHRRYRFVFNFNRTVPYGYRDRILEQLVSDLEQR